MPLARLRVVVATLWAGSLWTIGYLVAPTLFATLADRVLAGTIAASLFNNLAWLSIACAVVMLVLIWVSKGTETAGIFAGSARNSEVRSRKTLLAVVLVMLGCTLVSHFGLQPIDSQARLLNKLAAMVPASARSARVANKVGAAR